MTRKRLVKNQVELEIALICEIFTTTVCPHSLFLFGSAAENKMTDQSDFDLLVVCTSEAEVLRARRQFSKIRSSLPARAFDVVWMLKSEFDRKSQIGGVAFIALNDGRRLI